MKVSAPCSAFSDPTLGWEAGRVGQGGCGMLQPGDDGGRQGSPWPLLMKVGLQYFLWCLARVEELLPKTFLSCWAGPFRAIWLERAGFCGSFLFLCSLLEFLGSRLLQYLTWETQAKRNQRAHHSVLPVPRSVSVCLLSTFQNLLMFVLYIMSRVFSGGWQEEWIIMSVPTSWK